MKYILRFLAKKDSQKGALIKKYLTREKNYFSLIFKDRASVA